MIASFVDTLLLETLDTLDTLDMLETLETLDTLDMLDTSYITCNGYCRTFKLNGDGRIHSLTHHCYS
jgi:hypothetical protein